VLTEQTPGATTDGGWVDELLLAGPDRQRCLALEAAVDRGTLRAAVADRQRELTAAGLRPGGTVALRLPPSTAYLIDLLAAWRAGAQVTLLDHRLTDHEVDRALGRVAPQLVVRNGQPVRGPLRSWFPAEGVIETYPGRPAGTDHVLIQLSSGSTGPSKCIGRTVASLRDELARYRGIEGMAGPGERVVVLASLVHVLGLVGGLLHSLHTGIELAVPPKLTVDAILRTVAARPEPTLLLGVPSQAELLTAVAEPPALPQLTRMVTGGEPVRDPLWERFTDRYGTTLGSMYGMTETGVIATDIFGAHRPSLAPAPGLRIRESGGELLVSVPADPYVGLSDPTRWHDGWLHTRDAGRVDELTGRVTVHSRLDSQVSIGGLKVDLTEVEQTIGGAPGVTSAVVVYDAGIRAYVAVEPGADPTALDALLARELAAYKRPREIHLLPAIPLTATGKLLRDPAALRAAATQPAAVR
jgi:acyl-coenzyme A synthetase/AMP-(fatty) acid ligase